MAISDFVLMCKDFLMLILMACSVIINSLFSMPLFYSITVGHCLLGIISFSLIFGFLLTLLKSKFSSGE